MVLNDYVAGYIGAAGILAALRRRAREGGSYHVRISLARAAMWFMSLGSFETTDFDPTAPENRMIPLSAQRAMAQRAGATTVEVAASHAVYMSQPRAVAALIRKACV